MSKRFLDSSKRGAERQVELAYSEQKAKTFEIVESLLKDKDSLMKILPLVLEPSKKAEGINISQKIKTGMQAASFAFSNSSTVTKVLGLAPFYAKDMAKVEALLTNKEKYDPAYPPFFIRLLQDPDTLDKLKVSAPVLQGLVDEVTPLLTDIMLKELGSIDKLEKEYKAKQKDILRLPKLEEKLKELHKQDDSRIDKLQKNIDDLKFIKTSYEKALLLQKLQAVGIDRPYINAKLLPIVNELVKSALGKPEPLIKVLNLSVNMVLTQNQKGKKALQKQIFDAIDIDAIIKDDKLSKFLAEEGKNIAKAAEVIVLSNPKLQETLKNFGLVDSLLREGIPLVSELAGKVLQDSNGISTLYKAIKPVIFDDTASKIQKAATLREVKKLVNDKVEMLVSLAAKLTGILLQDDMLTVSKDQLPGFLTRHKDELAEMAVKVMPEVIKQKDNNAQELAGKCSNMDQDQVDDLINSPVMRVLTRVDPQWYGEALSLVIDLINNTMTALSKEQIKIISNNLKIVMDEKVEQGYKDQTKAELIEVVTHVLEDKMVRVVLATKLPKLLKVEGIKVLSNADSALVKEYELQKKFVDATNSLMLACTVLEQMSRLVEMNQVFTCYTDHKSAQKVEILSEIISGAKLVVVDALLPVLQTALPEYLFDD